MMKEPTRKSPKAGHKDPATPNIPLRNKEKSRESNIWIAVALVILLAMTIFSSQNSNCKQPSIDIMIATTPDGVDIYRDKIYIGTTNYSLQLKIGREYSYILRKRGYDDLPITIKAERDTSYHYTLIPSFTTIYVQSTPSGASIYGGANYSSLIGHTTHSIPNRQPGDTLKFKLTKSGYYDQMISIVVSQEKSNFHYNLQPILPSAARPSTPTSTSSLASICVVSFPAGASVFLNGDLAGRTPYNATHPAGKYELTLKKNGFKDWYQDFTLGMAGQNINATLQCRTGRLSVTIGPAEFTLWVGSRKYVNSLPDSVMCVGSHTIPIRDSRNVLLWQEAVEINENETTKLHINFKDTAYVFVSARYGNQPVDAYVIVDGDTIKNKEEALKTPLRVPVRVGWRELKLYHKDYEFEVTQFNASQKGVEIEKSLQARPVKNDTLSTKSSGNRGFQN
ncbi:PEGA domain-containing protein [candidate division KSB1 bacterium]|nr:PEGA domain-containing protein [bacterium]NUM66781.1 PEGA domain-containing protein [candidate division KSB1 bacterium]